MALLNLNRLFFQNKKGKQILPEYLDNQFNNVVDYINLDLIPYIESIKFEATSGVVGDKSAVFCNIRNNDTGYMYLGDTNFDNNLLPLSKLALCDKGSIVCSDIGGDIIAIKPDSNDQLLFGSLGRKFKFRKIKSDDLDNDVITGNKLQILENNNFVPNTFIDIILDGSINTGNLQNVSNDKIADDCIDFNHLGIFSDIPFAQYILDQVLIGDFDDNCITSPKFMNGNIDFANFIENKPIYAQNLLDLSIWDGHLLPYNPLTLKPVDVTIDGYKASNFSSIINMPGVPIHNVKLTREKIADKSLSKVHFNQEVQNAITKYEQIKQQALQPPIQIKKTRPDNLVPIFIDTKLSAIIYNSYYYPKQFGQIYIPVTKVPLRFLVDPIPNKEGKYWWYVSNLNKGYYLAKWGVQTINTSRLLTGTYSGAYINDSFTFALQTFAHIILANAYSKYPPDVSDIPNSGFPFFVIPEEENYK